jgi:hypothetical protein
MVPFTALKMAQDNGSPYFLQPKKTMPPPSPIPALPVKNLTRDG